MVVNNVVIMLFGNRFVGECDYCGGEFSGPEWDAVDVCMVGGARRVNYKCRFDFNDRYFPQKSSATCDKRGVLSVGSSAVEGTFSGCKQLHKTSRPILLIHLFGYFFLACA